MGRRTPSNATAAVIVAPYKRTPRPPSVAVLTSDYVVVDEEGREWAPGTTPKEVRVWVDYDTVRALVNAGHGEALCWNGEEIRWRAAPLDRVGWQTRASDVSVLKLPFPDSTVQTLRGLARWRDWLEGYGASPTGTAGSAAWSLLRARLERTLFTGSGDRPRLVQTMGGRMLVGPGGQGSYKGNLCHLDLSAAYASTLAGISYGGVWHRRSQLPAKFHSRTPDWWALAGRPCYVHARVRVPKSLLYGPLIRRPRARMSALQLYVDQLMNVRYPTGETLQGLWTWQEIQAAEDAGCRLLRVDEVWVHLGGWQAFAPWWAAVEQGRRLPGFAGLLAKITGNALWGRFCMIPGVGTKTVRSVRKGRAQSRPVRTLGGQPPAHDLAEAVSGQVRARLYDAIVVAGERLVSAHTDGFWADGVGQEELPEGWRLKGRARRLDLIDPQTMRYWPRPADEREPFHVFAGKPPSEAPAAFDEAWAQLERSAA
jgi:hypothetical protein